MSSDQESNNLINQFLVYCIGHRSFLFKGIILIGLASAAISLMLPKEYSSSAVMLPPSPPAMGLSSILPQKMTEGLSGAIGSGLSQNETSKAMAILRSQTLATNTIRKFNLMERYGSPVMELALQNFRSHVQFDFNDEGMIRTVVRTETPYFHWEEEEHKARRLSKEMSDYILEQIDSIYTALSTQKASYERQMIERRLRQNELDLDSLRQRVETLGSQYDIVDLTEQMKTAVQLAGEIKTQVIQEQIKVGVMRELYHTDNTDIKAKELQIAKLQSQLANLMNSSVESDSLRILPSFREAPALQTEFKQLQMELALQSELYTFLTQQYEQARIQETQDTPSLQILDHPVLPTKRTSPRRSIFVVLATGGGFVMLLFSLVLYEKWYLPNATKFRETWQQTK